MNQLSTEMQQLYGLSKYGFFPEVRTRDELPEYFAPWIRLRIVVTKLIKNEGFIDYVELNLPILDCNSIHLPDSLLRTASVYISHIAHAYAYEFRRKCQNPKAAITFPCNIEQPWQQVTQRMNRVCPQALFYEYFSWNVDSECEQIFFNVFNSNTSNKFIGCFARVEKTLGQTVAQIYAIDKFLSNQTLKRDELRSHLLKMIEPVYASIRVMREMMNTSRYDRDFFVNPALWAKTSASMPASTREGELGMSGGAAPVFKLLDIFLGRKVYESELGRQMSEKTYLPEHSRFIDLIKGNIDMIHEYLFAQKDTTRIFQQIAQLYYGERGYLGLHQKKVYGFMLVGLSAGRNHTNGGTLKTSQNNAVHQLDSEFLAARKERAMHIKTNYPLKLRLKEANMIGVEARNLIFDARDQIFKLWPGDKLAVTPKNSEEIVFVVLKGIKQLLVHMPKLLRYKVNLTNSKWAEFVEEHCAEDLLKMILTYSDLRRTVDSNLFKKFKVESKENIEILAYLHFLIPEIKFELREDFLEFLNWLIEVLDPMTHRYYSLCTSPQQLVDSGEIGLCVGLLNYKTKNSTMVSGVCSSYLHSVKVGEHIEARPVYAYWNVPQNQSTPIIMIAGGTGIAPILSLIKTRAEAGCFDNHLIFVTKNLDSFYFQDELNELVNAKKLKLYGAFSRDSKPCPLIKRVKTDIVTLLTSQRKLVGPAIAKQSACVYVCGRIEFASKCEQTIAKILEDTIDREKVPQLLVTMKHSGKYVEEAFTSYNNKSTEHTLPPVHILDVLSNDNYFEMSGRVYDVSEFKKIHPGGDFVFLVATDSDYDQVHGKDLVAKNRLDSLLVGKIAYKEDFNPHDLEELKKFKKLIGKYYCATDIPAPDRTASLLVEHQSSFVQNFHDYFVSSNIEALRRVASHKQFKESGELIKVVSANLPQDFIIFLWEKVEKFNFDFLFSLRVHLINLIREEKIMITEFDIYQNPYEKFSKYIFSFRKVAPLEKRDSLNTIKKRRLTRLSSSIPLPSNIIENEKQPVINVNLQPYYHYLDLVLFYVLFTFFFLIVPWSFNVKFFLVLIFGTIVSIKKDLKNFRIDF